MASLGSDLREWFLLREAESRAAGVKDHGRFHALVQRAHQKRAAAEALWAYGARAEALGLVRAALALGKDAATMEGAPAVPEPLATDARALLEVVAPELDADLRPEHDAHFAKVTAAVSAYDVALLPVALDRRERRTVRGVRVGGTALLLLVVLGLAIWLVRRPVQLKAEASASNGPRFPPQMAVDGAEATEWQLPDLAPGWLELAPLKPRPFSRLRILNGKNNGSPDRAVLDADVEIWSQGKVQKTIPVNLGPFSLKPEWRRIELGTGAMLIEKVRIVVKSWAGQGGAIAEAVLE